MNQELKKEEGGFPTQKQSYDSEKSLSEDSHSREESYETESEDDQNSKFLEKFKECLSEELFNELKQRLEEQDSNIAELFKLSTELTNQLITANQTHKRDEDVLQNLLSTFEENSDITSTSSKGKKFNYETELKRILEPPFQVITTELFANRKLLTLQKASKQRLKTTLELTKKIEKAERTINEELIRKILCQESFLESPFDNYSDQMSVTPRLTKEKLTRLGSEPSAKEKVETFLKRQETDTVTKEYALSILREYVASNTDDQKMLDMLKLLEESKPSTASAVVPVITNKNTTNTDHKKDGFWKWLWDWLKSFWSTPKSDAYEECLPRTQKEEDEEGSQDANHSNPITEHKTDAGISTEIKVPASICFEGGKDILGSEHQPDSGIPTELKVAGSLCLEGGKYVL